MPIDPILPSVDTLIVEAQEALRAERPASFQHINLGTGRWSHVIAMWRAQISLALSRLADELRQRRRLTATGEGLFEYARSELDLDVPRERAFAVGKVVLSRATTGAGIIAAGTRFRRLPDPSATPVPIQGADYEATETVLVDTNDATVTVPIRAVTAGTQANVVYVAASPSVITPSDPLFDRFTHASSEVAGGDDGFDEGRLRRLLPFWVYGRHGSVRAALTAWALRMPGVGAAAAFDLLGTRTSCLYAADPSWATSQRFRLAVEQYLADNAVGFGLTVLVRNVSNVYCKVTATVQLRDARYLSDTTQITARIVPVLRRYFDERADWYNWRETALRGLITRADRRILTCTAASVIDTTGGTLTEPNVSDASLPSTLRHFDLLPDGVEITYQAPA